MEFGIHSHNHLLRASVLGSRDNVDIDAVDINAGDTGCLSMQLILKAMKDLGVESHRMVTHRDRGERSYKG